MFDDVNSEQPPSFDVSTRELLVITLRELGKKTPVLGEILSAQDAVMGKIEASRLATFLERLEGRIGRLERDALMTEAGRGLLVLVADAVRNEIRNEKLQFYANLIISFATGMDADSAIDVLENLKRLNPEDVSLLQRLDRAHGRCTVNGLCGLVMSSMTDESIPDSVHKVLPEIMRLQGFGLVGVYPPKSQPQTGFFNPRLDSLVRQEIVISALGRKIARAVSSLG